MIAMMIVQIVMNNVITHYGALSIYGSAIPLACVGIIMKVNQLYFSVVIGLAQGSQPIESFNYGARQYPRVKKAYWIAIKTALIIGIIAFFIFQLFPRQILMAFGSNTELYFDFGVRFFRTFLFFTWLNIFQPISSTFFTSIGKAKKGAFLSLTRQIIYLLPSVLIFPAIGGLLGLLYAAPLTDVLSAITAFFMMRREFKEMNRLQAEVEAERAAS